MDSEAAAILGLANLAIRKFIKSDEVELQKEYLKYLNYIGFSEIFNLSFTDGAMDLVFNRFYPHTPFHIKSTFDINDSTDGIS
jgi:hypothetical protein